MDITEIRKRRLAEAERIAGGVAALAEAAQLSEKYLRQIRSGFQGKKDRRPRRLGDEAARKIETALCKPQGWMDSLPAQADAPTDRPPPDALPAVAAQASGESPTDGYVRLQVLAEAAAGPGRLANADPEVVEHIDVLEAWIRQSLRANPARVRVLTARGHSMSGVVEDGDLLFVEPCTAFEADGLYVLAVGDLLRVKRLRLRIADRQLSIESTDGSAPELVPLAAVGDSVRVQGRVVGAWTLRRF